MTMSAPARKLALLAALLVASVAQAQTQVEVVVIASAAADEYDALVYREIWDEYG